MAETFDELATAIRKKALYTYQGSPIMDDLAQEAVLFGWKLYMDGKEAPYILYWSVKQAVRHLGDKPAPFTGSAGEHGGTRETSTTKQGDLNREKIKQAQREYYELHGSMPSNAEIGRMVGMETRRVSKYVNRLNFHTAFATGPPKITYLEAMADGSADGDPSYLKAVAQDGFEDKTLDALIVRDILPELKDQEREVVFLQYWQDMSQADISRTLHISPAYTHRLHKAAINRLRTILDVGI